MATSTLQRIPTHTATSSKTPVGIYLRVSDPSQAEDDKVSLSEQERAIREYCDRKGYQIIRRYEDAGYKGWSRHRPDFKEMLSDIRGESVQVVVAWNSDRFLRGLKPLVELVDAIDEVQQRVQLESVTDFMSMEALPYLAIQARSYIKRLGENSLMGKRGKARQGFVTHRVKFGYILKGKKGETKPAINEEEAAIVRRIFNEYIAGNGADAVAGILNRDGLVTKTGKPWGRYAIADIIKSEVYIGKGHFGVRSSYFTDDGTRDVRHTRINAKENWIHVPYPAIIEETTFTKAQRARKRRNPNPSHAKKWDVPYLLTGIIYCEFCGIRYSASSGKAYTKRVLKDGTVKKYELKSPRRMYKCNKGSRRKSGIEPCSRPRLYAPKIEREVWATVEDFLSNPDRVRASVEEERKNFQRDGTDARLDEMHQKLKEVESERQRILGQHRKEYITDSELDVAMSVIKQRKAHYDEEVEYLQSEVVNCELRLEALRTLESRAAELRRGFKNIKEEQKQRLVELFVDSILVREGGDIQVRFNIGVWGDLAVSPP